MTRILLTGAGGFIGHHTLDYFLEKTDFEIVCIESFRHKGMSARLREILDKHEDKRSRVEVISHDLVAPIDPVTAHRIGEIDFIINMASESHVDRSIQDPRHFIENNVMLVTSMLDYARTLPDLKMFIQVSTDEVYGPTVDGKLHVEYDSIIPSNPYSASKAAQEAIAISYWRTYDVPVVITNTMNNIGERQDPEKFVAKIIRHLSAGTKVPVHARLVDGKWVSGSRFYLHAINHADALLFIINSYDQHAWRRSQGAARPQRLHVIGDNEVSNEEMVNLVASIMGLEGDWTDFQDVEGKRPGHDLRYGLDRGDLQSWGWTLPVSFEDALERTVKWSLQPENKIWTKLP
jgi:dTDP-glucose 4,6-dehydratase